MKLILVRHGKTLENERGIIQGHQPGRLSEEGKEQVRRLALRLKDERLDCIYSSDLKRAADTAREIAAYHPGVPLCLTELLRERDHGALTGKAREEVDWDTFWHEGESEDLLAKRAREMLDSAYAAYPEGTVVFVGHGGINKAITSVILGIPAGEMDAIARQRNTSVSVFTLREDKNHELHLLDCVKHLE